MPPRRRKQGLHTQRLTAMTPGAASNNATRGSGSKLSLRTSETVWNIDRQKCSNLGHVQNMWISDPSSHLHPLHMRLVPGIIWASLTLDICALCTTLNCMSECWAHIEDVWTCLRIQFHVSSESGLSRSSSQALLMLLREEDTRLVIRLSIIETEPLANVAWKEIIQRIFRRHRWYKWL